MVTPDHKIILLLLFNCNFAAIINDNINIWYIRHLICGTPQEVATHRLRTTALGGKKQSKG